MTEPANTCYRSDVLAGENGEEPPITVVASVASNAAASGNETVQVSAAAATRPRPPSVTAATTIQQAADLNVASSALRAASPRATAPDTYTLTVSNVIGPNSTTGGPSLGPGLP